MLLNALFDFQFGDFTEVSPNWFDWLSLACSIVGIIAAFLFARYIYTREKKDRLLEENLIQQGQTRLFDDSLAILRIATTHQIESLQTHVAERNFNLQLQTGVNAEFLQLVDVRYIYKSKGVNEQNIEVINHLLTGLYTIKDFEQSLRNIGSLYFEKYNFHESKFYSYRRLLYADYYKLCHKHGDIIHDAQGNTGWHFNPEEQFMIQYSQLRAAALQDLTINTATGLNRDVFVEVFILPLINAASQFIPMEEDAIEIHNIANEVNSAFKDMSKVVDVHFTSISSHILILQKLLSDIENYSKLGSRQVK